MPEKSEPIKLTGEQLLKKYQYEREKFDSFNKHRDSLIGLLTETNAALETVKVIEKAKDKEKILVPIGVGGFIEAKIEDKKIKNTMTGNVAVEKTTKEMQEDLKKRAVDLEENIKKLDAEQQKLAKNLVTMENIFRQIQAKQQQAQARK